MFPIRKAIFSVSQVETLKELFNGGKVLLSDKMVASTKLQLWVINSFMSKIKTFTVAWELDYCLGQ